MPRRDGVSGGNFTAANMRLSLGGAIKATASKTFTGAAGVTNPAPGADVFSDGSGKVLTIAAMPAGLGLRAWCGCVDNGDNAAGAVQILPGPPEDY